MEFYLYETEKNGFLKGKHLKEGRLYDKTGKRTNRTGSEVEKDGYTYARISCKDFKDCWGYFSPENISSYKRDGDTVYITYKSKLKLTAKYPEVISS